MICTRPDTGKLAACHTWSCTISYHMYVCIAYSVHCIVQAARVAARAVPEDSMVLFKDALNIAYIPMPPIACHMAGKTSSRADKDASDAADL